MISNARWAINQKAPEAGDRTLEVQTRPIEVGGRRMLRTTFLDHGPGIPAELLDKVFDPFFSTKPAGEGTGLGLSISQGIIRDRGGRLWLESVFGEYTRAVIDLPVYDEEDKAGNGQNSGS